MRKLFSIAVVCLALASAARAQFIGYVSPQTVTQPVFNAVNTAQASAVLPNVGQSQHELCYSSTDLGASFQLRIEWSFDGTTYNPLSDDATNQSSGCIYGQGAYPYIRANLLFYSSFSGGRLTAYYTGTSSTTFPLSGALNQSQQIRKILTMNSSQTNASYGFAPPCGNTTGTVWFQYNSGRNTGAQVVIRYGPTSTQLSAVAAVVYSVANTGTIQAFPVPPNIATFIEVDVESIPGGATYSTQYLFGCPALGGAGVNAQVVAGLLQPQPIYNAETVSATNAAASYIVGATPVFGAPAQTAYIFSVSARCSAGTAGLTIQNNLATTLWSTGAAEVGTTTFRYQWNPGLASAINQQFTVTLSACGAGNTGTLDVQASAN